MVLGAGGEAVLQPGTQVAVDTGAGACKSHAMTAPAARIEVVVKNDANEPSASAKVDPEDLASRNARGETAAKPHAKEQPGESYEDDGNDKAKPKKGKPFPPDDDDDDDDDEDERGDRSGDVVRGAVPRGDGKKHGEDDDMDAYDASYDGTFGTKDEELTSEARDKIKASNFAAPGSEKLPIHDPAHVRAAMSRFGQTQFKSADEKHGAFNRIKSKAKQFGISSEGFEKAHGGKLDRADGAEEFAMTTDIKALQEKADKRKAKLVAAKARIDSLEAEKTALEVQVTNLTKDLETAKAARTDAAAPTATATETQITERVELLEQARGTGAKVDAKMSPRAIKVATIKHVDGDDVPDTKADAYVDGVYEGALKRSKKDAADTVKGNAALDAARLSVETNRTNTHLDATTDEEEAKARLREANRQMINQPAKHRVAAR
jgi:hypothetical protein